MSSLLWQNISVAEIEWIVAPKHMSDWLTGFNWLSSSTDIDNCSVSMLFNRN